MTSSFRQRPLPKRCAIRGHRLAAVLVAFATALCARAEGIGVFESAGDLGECELKGSSDYRAVQALYRITGGGKNIWSTEDAGQFLWKKMAGDLAFTMEVAWEAEGKEPHRKACAMVRQTLDADSPYVDVAVHGDGLIELQYRIEKSGTSFRRAPPRNGNASPRQATWTST